MGPVELNPLCTINIKKNGALSSGEPKQIISNAAVDVVVVR